MEESNCNSISLGNEKQENSSISFDSKIIEKNPDIDNPNIEGSLQDLEDENNVLDPTDLSIQEGKNDKII